MAPFDLSTMRYLLLCWLILLGCSAAPAQSREYTGGNRLTLVINTAQGQQTLTFRTLEGRLNTALEQLEFIVPISSTELVAYTDTVDVAAALTDTNDPIMIIASFPKGSINLEDFNSQPQRFAGEVHLAGQVFPAPVQLGGRYQNDRLILDMEANITDGLPSVVGREVESVQLYARGVRIYHLTDE